ncbi:MAG: GAF domain-containing protein, partial [Chloroflexi bacterium]|nr:GAF domain-containing protein [Chloroflexota bacterium]
MDAEGQRLSSAVDGVAVLDGFGKLVRYDGAAAKLLGLPSPAVWRDSDPSHHFESPAVAVLTALAQSQRRSSKPPTITRRKITLPRAEPLQVELILTQVKDAEGVLAGTVVTIHPAEGPSAGERGGPRNRWQMRYMLSNATNGLTDLKEALTALLRASSQILPVDSAALFACENDDSELRIIASLNMPADIHERISFRVGEGIVGWVIAERQAVIIPNVLEDARYRPSLPGRWEGARSLLVVPIVVRGRTLAALNLTRYRPNAFSNEDLKWAQLVASQAARLLTRFRERLLPPSTRSAEMAHLLRPFVQALWASANFLTQYIGLLAKQGDLSPTSVEIIQAASLQTKRLETMAIDALDLVGLLRQPSALKKRPTDIN